ncbi:MAG: hypothetical protein U1E65_19855 [Myxococcota bacterium]
MALLFGASAWAEGVQTSTSVAPEITTFALPRGGRLRLSGYLHADAVVYDQLSSDELDPSTRSPLNEERFAIRRAGLRADAGWGFAGAGIEIEGNTNNGPNLRLLAAEAWARWPSDEAVPLLELVIGQTKVPFGKEAPTLAKTRLFHTSPLFVRALFPGEYDLGLILRGGWEALRYSVALMNGDPIGEPKVGGQDVTATKDLIARLGLDTELGLVHLSAGASALYGQGLHAGTPATKDLLTWKDQNEDGLVQLSELQSIPGSAATPSIGFERFALGADLRLVVAWDESWETRFFGELVWAKDLDRGLFVADPVAASRSLRELGFVIGVVQALGPWVDLGLRLDRYDGDADATDLAGATRVPSSVAITDLRAVLGLHWEDHLGISAEYLHQENLLGRGENGRPARLPSDSLSLRAKVGF